MKTVENNRLRILAVDDTEDTLELISMTLESEFDVMTLSNPLELYEFMDLFQPDLLILDIMMPKISGYQLMEMLRRNPHTKGLPIIIISAKSAAGEIKHGYKLGATLYLTKPFQPDRLLKNVKTQFDLNTPSSSKKAHSLEEVIMALEPKQSYKEGHVKVNTTVPLKKNILDFRTQMEDKIKRQMLAKKRQSNQ